jgi:addiction module HigA family antidote
MRLPGFRLHPLKGDRVGDFAMTRYDCLEPLGLSVSAAAGKLGVSRKKLSGIVNGRAGISPEMAIGLDKAFGGGAETWLRLQRPTTSPGDARRRPDQG